MLSGGIAAVLVRAYVGPARPRPTTFLDVNTDWALNQLGEFLRLLDYKDRPGMYAATYVGTEDEIAAQKVVVDRVWSKVLGPKPVVPISGNDPYRFDPRVDDPLHRDHSA